MKTRQTLRYLVPVMGMVLLVASLAIQIEFQSYLGFTLSKMTKSPHFVKQIHGNHRNNLLNPLGVEGQARVHLPSPAGALEKVGNFNWRTRNGASYPRLSGR